MNVHWLWPPVFALSFILTWLTMRAAVNRRLMDFPNERSAHDVPLPRGGGIAVVLAYASGLVAVAVSGTMASGLLVAVLVGGGLVALIGLLDDVRNVPAAWRLLLHGLAAAWGLYWLGGIPDGLLPAIPAAPANVLGVVCIVWLINLYNFMDGIDGIASIETLTVSIGGIVLYACVLPDDVPWAVLLLLMASVAGFLCWNYPPARIFLGDTGSGFLGFMMAVFCVQAAHFDPAVFWAWLILLGVFIVDSGVTLARRMLRGERPHEAHRGHAYQAAARQHGHAPVSLAVGAINLAWLLPVAVLAAKGLVPAILALPIAYAPLFWLAFRFRAGAPAPAETGA